VTLQDDFIFSGPETAIDDGTIGKLGWNFFASGAGTGDPTAFAGSDNHPGGVYWSSGSAGGAYGSLYSNFATYPFNPAVDPFRITMIFRNADGTHTDTDWYCGMRDNVTTAATTNGIEFYKTSGSANFFCRTNDSGSSTATDTGIAWAANTFRTFVIDNMDLGSVKFYIDGVLVATHTDDIPDTRAVQVVFHSRFANVDRNFAVDYFDLAMKVNR
jgi:hypothetical protein